MNDWLSYSLSDFIPFTSEVYLRLLERINETYWPLHLLLAGLALVLINLSCQRHIKTVLALLAITWAWLAYGFMISFYTELNWAGNLFAFAFLLQGGLLLVFLCYVPPGDPAKTIDKLIAYALISVSTLWPLFFPLGRNNWQGLECFGIHADPTVVMSLGIILLLMHGWKMWALSLIPLAWLTISLLTQLVLNLPQAWIIAGILLVSLITFSGKTLSGMTKEE